MYAEIAYNNLNVKAGRFYSLLGYERVPAVQNFFYSHAHSMVLPTQQLQPKTTVVPYTHTGFLAEYSPSCQLTMYGGWVAGWDSGFQQHGGGDAFLGGFAYDFNDARTLNYSAIMGDFGQIDGAAVRQSDSDGYLHTIVFDWDVTCRLNCVVQSIYGDNAQWYGTGLPGSTGKVFSMSNYMLYTINCKWAFATRFDWLKLSGQDEFASFTVGANYRPCANVILRPEFRMDEFNGTAMPEDQTSFGLDAIITF